MTVSLGHGMPHGVAALAPGPSYQRSPFSLTKLLSLAGADVLRRDDSGYTFHVD
jgi:hypothetical protein